MSYSFNIEDFKELYCNQLKNKEDILKELNVSEYLYKTIIKEFALKRIKTSKINRFKVNNKIEVVKIQEDEPRTESKIINPTLDEELKNQIIKKLEESKKNRNKKI